eukprot:jgi/Orpsp1_1/1183500/evm.model.c7180000085473.2
MTNSKNKNISKESIKKKELKLSFFQLYRYSNGIEKLMTFAGIICSFILGCCMPAVVYYLGDVLEILIAIVINLNIKHITGIEDVKNMKKK